MPAHQGNYEVYRFVQLEFQKLRIGITCAIILMYKVIRLVVQRGQPYSRGNVHRGTKRGKIKVNRLLHAGYR